MILLVVDTQKAITNDELYQFKLFEARVKKLISEARHNSVEVIFVRHDDGAGNELTKGNDGFKMIVPAGTNSTFENQYMSAEQTYRYYNEYIWNNRYAECVSFEKTLELLK